MTPPRPRASPFSVLYLFIAVWGADSGLHGSETRFVKTVEAYRSLGAEVTTVERSPSITGGAGTGGSETAEVKVYSFRENRLPLDALTVISAVRRGVQLSRARPPPDVVLCGDRNWVNLFPAYILSKLLRRPLGIVVHHLDEGDAVSLARRPNYPGPLGLLRGIGVALLHEANYAIGRRADVIIAVSKATMRDFSAAWGVPPDKFLVSGCGLGREPCPSPEDRPVDAVYTGTFLPYKGVLRLPEIWKSVLEERPGSRLVVAGGYGSQLEELRGAVDAIGLTGDVSVRGYLSDEELAALYANAKLFVLPSLHEGFSMSTAEAMASGCACVISDLAALREVFGQAAVYAPPGDAGAFASQICALLADDGRRAALSRRGAELAGTFTWDRVASTELKALKTLKARKATSPR
ncbi:MAG: glycosyltransferase [Nitrososphaerota archaeon]|nr:glycosyltransferase [Nitrososphaerota archaeon]MDG6990737.1 glycosyltransferase [Nitrososphaerota archaeon]